MNNTWIKSLTGATIAAATIITGSLHAQDAVLVMPDKGDVMSIKAKGRIMFQAGYVEQENDVNSGDWSTMEVRRARIGLTGKFANDIKGEVEANIVPGSVSVRSAVITWDKDDAFTLSGGYDKPMSSLEENTSSASILTVERSNVNNTIAAPGETVGLWAAGESGPLFYHVGIYNGEDPDNTRNTSNVEAEYMFNAHGGVTFDLSENSSILAQVSYLQTDDPNSDLGFEDTTAVALHFEAGAFDLRAEYFMGTDGDEDTTGFYVMPSMKLNDSLEVVARYEVAESDSGSGIRAQSRYARRTDVVVIGEDEEGDSITADRGDEFSALYLGLNYYYQKYNKVMVGIEFSELENTDAGTLESTTVFGAYRVRF
jgi:hypothetical protein